ncbi:uncharacterized protein EI97DRAFT_453357 [Westerdykella ornata]|uniref:FAS1 domain-containing protein n=1 Tax=Westerdykella ornata TaxID=318751 RepID=A0A6A6J748_WESOR|nr:uncharacterized protein EI97DRAFT_453357 [Westerdykella ornata]KAF2271983.1 hypothetical protein EI97DRAFT_453357 [Westerdykella ornata]
MKPAQLFLYPSATICLILAASAQSRPLFSLSKAFHALADQIQVPVLFPNPLTHNKNMPPPENDNTVSTGVIISDVIGKTQSIAIFSGLTRDIDSISRRLDDASQNATVLAPQNGVMRELKRKPWEDPQDYAAFGEKAYEGGEGEDRAHRNLRRFVEAHVVPLSPWEEGRKVKTLAGSEVWYETKEGKKVIQPHGVEVVSIADKVANGEVWVLAGSLA